MQNVLEKRKFNSKRETGIVGLKKPSFYTIPSCMNIGWMLKINKIEISPLYLNYIMSGAIETVSSNYHDCASRIFYRTKISENTVPFSDNAIINLIRNSLTLYL